MGSDETAVRKLISRVRHQFADSYVDRYGAPVNESALIQTTPWNGYRLNPNVLILAPGEIIDSSPGEGDAIKTKKPNRTA